MNGDKNCDCAGFFNTLNVALILFFFVTAPVVAFIVMIEWAVLAAWAARPARPQPAPLLTPEQKAEREAVRLRQDAEQQRRQMEVWARAIEAEDRLRLYAP